MPDDVYLSVVVPAYNESDRILPTLGKLAGYLNAQPYRSEVLVVDDGSRDRTREIVSDFGARERLVRLIAAEHRGKGGAVKRGMLEAAGAYRFLCDADLSMPVDELAKFLPSTRGTRDSGSGDDFEVAIGSREVAGARRYDEPWLRHLMGRVFNLLVRLIAVPGISDTQCGFKCFTRKAAEAVFPRQRMDGFGFDVEVLFIARKHGLRVVEVPIDWYHVPKSKVDPLRDTLRMVSETLNVRLNDLRGRYD